MDQGIDEFSFLPEQAREVGVTGTFPGAERRTTPLADGRRLSALHYTTASAPAPTARDTASPVVFLHGAGLNAHTWDATILTLGLSAIALDLPGHGDSSWRDDLAYTARPLAADIAGGLDAVSGAPFVVVGHSLGGWTAAALAAARPDLVRALVIVDITPGIDMSAGPAQLQQFFAGPTDWASRDELVDRAIAFGLGGASREKVARGVYFNSRVRDDGRVEWKHHFARLANVAAAAPNDAPTAQRPSAAPDGWDDLDAVRAPITLVRAERGFVGAEDAAEFRRRLPTASVISVSAGHNVQEDAPAELAAIVRSAVAGA
ncbi:alpha/beta fold hydrolase [Microbacterium sp. C7(2022)]|uniref:alpha/beta fold hydrolase n=1 Tax=Microbacterium sp. C7(2022) TaxID=2992759 RepID=UPI00237A2464|nr:alpha/beta hydrolase [Microbacterium sp. C7(2022)]MDE0547252.1 alpha/beta hydrolase [Microbacterium sp. C7(2022)]